MSAPALVVLTGAGISQESGLDTFRDPDGIWSKYRIEDVATPEAFDRDPRKVHDFYNMRRRNLLVGHVKPNAAHTALAALERRWPGEFLLVTQNIDDLHERAGSRRLVHMHGEMRKVRCAACGAVTAHDTDLSLESACSACARPGALRPHVVSFGTSGNVYPAAGFVAEANAAGARTVELNLEPSLGRSHFVESRYGKATEIVPAFVAALLAGR